MNELLEVLGLDALTKDSLTPEKLKEFFYDALVGQLGEAGKILGNLLGIGPEGVETQNTRNLRQISTELGNIAYGSPQDLIPTAKQMIAEGRLNFESPELQEKFLQGLEKIGTSGTPFGQYLDLLEDTYARGVPYVDKAPENDAVNYGNSIVIDDTTRAGLTLTYNMQVYSMTNAGVLNSLDTEVNMTDIPNGAEISLVKDEDGINSAFIDCGDGRGYYVVPEEENGTCGFDPKQMDPDLIKQLNSGFDMPTPKAPETENVAGPKAGSATHVIDNKPDMGMSYNAGN